MALFVLLALALLLACAMWLLLSVDSVVEPAMASGGMRSAVEASTPRAVNVAVADSDAVTGELVTEPTPERTAVVRSGPRYWIRGAVTRAGVGQPGRDVLCSSGWGKTPQTFVTGRDGVFEFEVEPGKYELYAPHMFGITRQQSGYKMPPSGRDRLAAARCSCVVETADVDIAIKVSAYSLNVTVRNAKTFAPIPWAEVVWRPPIPEFDELVIPVDPGGRVRISDATAGLSELVASARAFVVARKDVEVRGADQSIDFLLEPACAVDVVMVDDRDRDRAVAVSKAQILSLQPKAGGSAVYPSDRKRFLSKERPLATPFDAMAVGVYDVLFDDDYYGGAGEDPTVRFARSVRLLGRAGLGSN